MESWKGYCNSKSKGSVIAQISAQNREEVIMNRKYVMQLIDIIQNKVFHLEDMMKRKSH